MKDFIKKIWSFIKRRKWWFILVVIAIGGGVWYNGSKTATTASQFATMPVTRGNLRAVVTATGQINPVNTIMVGSQVSGNIEKIFVDYNDVVKKGQVLLTIDPTVLQASVDEAKATLDSANSQLSFDKSEYNRSSTLYNSGYIARSEMEQARTKYQTSQQNVKKAQSQYDRAVTNLGYATIKSPVDGTVIARKVDLGQTVAASFQAPDLFQIAEDLSKMQIETSVSEADIGNVKMGQPVTFTVDAYPTQTFRGSVKQIRLSPTTTSNVVVYTVIIEVDNSDLKLMPGMTAFVTIEVDSRTDVLKAANAAFLLRSFDGIVDNPGDAKPRNNLAIERQSPVERSQSPVVLVPYKKGLVTATETEIIPDAPDSLNVGDKIIVGKLGQASTATGGQMIGQRGGMGGGGGMPGGGRGGR